MDVAWMLHGCCMGCCMGCCPSPPHPMLLLPRPFQCQRAGPLPKRSSPLPKRSSAEAVLCQSDPLPKRSSAEAVLCRDCLVETALCLNGQLPKQRSSAKAVLLPKRSSAEAVLCQSGPLPTLTPQLLPPNTCDGQTSTPAPPSHSNCSVSKTSGRDRLCNRPLPPDTCDGQTPTPTPQLLPPNSCNGQAPTPAPPSHTNSFHQTPATGRRPPSAPPPHPPIQCWRQARYGNSMFQAGPLPCHNALNIELGGGGRGGGRTEGWRSD